MPSEGMDEMQKSLLFDFSFLTKRTLIHHEHSDTVNRITSPNPFQAWLLPLDVWPLCKNLCPLPPGFSCSLTFNLHYICSAHTHRTSSVDIGCGAEMTMMAGANAALANFPRSPQHKTSPV